MKILQAQMVVSQSKDEALQTVEEACKQAVRVEADFLTLPEMFCCPYETVNFPRYAEAEGGNVWSRCAALAKRYNIYISAGSVPELGEAGEVYNTAYIFDRQGRQIAKHRKMHLFDIDVKGEIYFKESDTLSSGNDFTIIETELASFGIGICYDIRFVELSRIMALNGAEILIFPGSTGKACKNR